MLIITLVNLAAPTLIHFTGEGNLLKTLTAWLTESAAILNHSKSADNQNTIATVLRTVSLLASTRDQVRAYIQVESAAAFREAILMLVMLDIAY